MGLPVARARSCVRLSLGYYNTEADVDCVLKELPPIIERLRAQAPARPSAKPRSSPDAAPTHPRHRVDSPPAHAVQAVI
jgi:hypothetical protein